MDRFQEASRLNRVGVDALVQGSEDVALKSLAASMTVLKHVLTAATSSSMPNVQWQQELQQSPPKRRRFFEPSAGTVKLPSIHLGANNNNNDKTDNDDHDNDDHSILFHQGILFSAEDCSSTSNGQWTTTGPDEVLVCTAAVVLNLALCYHRKGEKSGLAAFTTKAEKLYSMALQLLGSSNNSCNNNSTLCILGLVLQLASLNNLLGIQWESGNYQHDHRQQEGILAQIRQFLIHNNIGTIPWLQEANIQGLIMNIMLLKPPQVAPAA
jgi:hypothetical protein